MTLGPNWAGLDKGFLAKGSDAYKIGQPVKFDTDPQSVSAISGALTATTVVGICQENIDANKVATGKAIINVRLAGLSKGIAGATNIPKGTRLTVNTSGQFVAATTGNRVIATATEVGPATVGLLMDVILADGTTVLA